LQLQQSISIQFIVVNLLSVFAGFYRGFYPFFPLSWQKYFLLWQKPNPAQHICSTALIPVWSGAQQVNFSKLLERHIFQARCSFCHKHHNDYNDDEKNNNIN